MTVYDLRETPLDLQTSDEYWVAPSASVIGDVVLKQNASVWFGAVLRGDNETIVIGENSNVQDNCVLHTDIGFPMVIGPNVTIGHMATIHGATVGEGTMIGIGAIVLNGARIGRNCIVGAGALVTEGKVIPDGSLILGSPGRVVRAITEAEIEMIAKGVRHYVINWKRFAAGLVVRT